MLSIGEFAGVTGLSVKALRHYDEKGALAPADVSDTSGYRRYDERQVRDGVVVKTLRDAGVPLPAVADALAAGTALDVLEAHRQQVLAARDAQDRAHRDARAVLQALAMPVDVIERDMPAQAFVARALPVAADAIDDLGDEAANAVFEELYGLVEASGLGPTGGLWTAIRTADRGAVEVLCCWPTVMEPEAGWGGDGVIVRTLPARRELTAIWRSADELPGGAVHPAAVALFDALGERRMQAAPFEVRQSVVAQATGEFAVHVSVSLAGED